MGVMSEEEVLEAADECDRSCEAISQKCDVNVVNSEELQYFCKPRDWEHNIRELEARNSSCLFSTSFICRSFVRLDETSSLLIPSTVLCDHGETVLILICPSA